MRAIFFIVFFSFQFSQAFVDDDIEFARKILVQENQKIEQAFFTPDKSGVMKKVLLGLIKNEKKEICAAQFRLTDPEVTQALLEAFVRGVKVTIITDYGNFAERYEKVTKLFESGIATRYYAVPYSIMHHKYFVFKDNFFEKPILVTGSANCTKGGLGRNYENLIMTNAVELIERYMQHFTQLEQCTLAGIPGQIMKQLRRIKMKKIVYDSTKIVYKYAKYMR
jgi:phospholipase D